MKSTFAALALLAAGPALAEPVVVNCGKLFDSERARIVGAHVLTIEDGQITGLERGRSDAEGAIELDAMTCLPGLIDLHVHLQHERNPDSYLERFQLNAADYAFRAAANARKTLHAGFTTVRNVGDSYDVTIALRKAIEEGLVEGPRVFSAGKSIATTGGHADPTNAYRQDLMGDPGPGEGVINGPDEAARAVRQRYKDGADLIKITATGGVLSSAKSGLNPQFTDAELKAIVDTARDYDLHVAAHAHGAEGMKRAIRAGVRSIEHGTLMDDEVMDLMIEHEVWLVPTIMAGEWVANKAQVDGYFPDIVRPKAAQIGPKIQATAGRAFKRGVPMAYGTDSGVSAHGDNAQELILLQQAGVPPAQALKMATFNAAQVMGLSDQLGQLAVGHHADLVAVAGDPVENLALMLDVPFVMKAGAVVKHTAE